MLKRAHWFGLAALMLLAPLAAFSEGCQGTCVTTADCGDGQFCSLAVGVCSTPRALGFCKPVPDTCPDVVALACGCDGVNYPNSCKASLKGQSVANTGACLVACGGSSNVTCAAGNYCQFADATCGTAGTTGICTPLPTSCAGASPIPVCGCDGKTYGNACEAQSAGVNVAATGVCTCGGTADAKCAKGEYCDYLVGTCSSPNAAGTCATPPKTCPPISGSLACGCDGKTYNSACEAAQAQVGLYSTTTGCPCGGASNALCGADEYCVLLPIGQCQAPNAAGTCAPRPKACNGGTPVCGCDGVTYANGCAAAQAGTSVAAAGACTVIADAGGGG